MHINTDRIGNVFLHPVWSKAVLVPPAETLQQEHDDESPDIDGTFLHILHGAAMLNDVNVQRFESSLCTASALTIPRSR